MRDSALRYLAEWDSLGGLLSTVRFERDLGWEELGEEPRARRG